MFSQTHPRNLVEAFFTTMGLIYTTTVKNLRQSDRSPIMGILRPVIQSAVMIGMMYVFYAFLGVKRSPIPGSFLLYIFSGIFMFLTQNQAMAAVAGAPNGASPVLLHGPMNTAIAVTAKALTNLYQLFLSSVIMLVTVNYFFEPLNIDNVLGFLGMFLLAWFTGASIGMVLYAATPWAPEVVNIIKLIYMRLNMVASGKMFVANMLNAKMLALFSWNPLFHTIDQARGYAFLDYNPYFSDWTYPLKVAVVFLVVGMLWEHYTRKFISVSWSAGK